MIAASVRRALRGLALGVTAILAGPALAGTAGVGGDADNYNVFIFNSGNFYSENTDTMGNLAAGGSVSLMNYSVAAGINGNSALSPNPARLVVGGTLSAQNGGVGENQAGAIYTNNTPSLTSFTATGGVHAQTIISSFAADGTEYTNLSATLSGYTANGTAVLAANSDTLTLTGTSTGLNVIDVTASQINSSQTINISAPAGSTVLLNVAGTDDSLSNGQVSETGVTDAQVLYNFYQATTVTLTGSKDPMGSILAPLAGVVGGYGAMHGQLIAGSYGGSTISGSDNLDNTQFDNVLFTGNLTPTPVPLPSSAWLMLSALAGLGLVLRRKGGVVQPASPGCASV